MDKKNILTRLIFMDEEHRDIFHIYDIKDLKRIGLKQTSDFLFYAYIEVGSKITYKSINYEVLGIITRFQDNMVRMENLPSTKYMSLSEPQDYNSEIGYIVREV